MWKRAGRQWGILALLLAVLAFAACGGEDDTGATAIPDDGLPDGSGQDVPSAYVRDTAGAAEPLFAGTGCWNGKCVDMAGPLTNVDPLPMTTGQTLAFSFEAGVPDTFTVTWFLAPSPEPAPEGGLRAWAGLGGAGDATGTTAPAAPGRYVMVLFAKWAGKGDMTYGLYANVATP